jgi:hypothetical protein
MLLMTGVELDLLKDSDMYLFFERIIRGGQSVIFNKYAEQIMNIWKIMMKIWIIPVYLI